MAVYITKTKEGSNIFICGTKKALGPHCSDCLGFADFLCDYPISKNKTCNRKVCADHCHEIHHEHHYCTAHFKEYSIASANNVFKTEVPGNNDA